MWWLFFYHLSEIKWIFHLSEIIVHYRKDFSQNKRGQSEHRLTGEVKPTGLFYFSNSRFVYTDDSLAHFLLPKQLFPTLHFPLCRCTFMVKFLQHQKYAIHARRLRLLRLKKKKKKGLLTVSLWKSKSAQRGRDSHDGFTPTFWPAAAFFSNTSLYFFSSYICEANK